MPTKRGSEIRATKSPNTKKVSKQKPNKGNTKGRRKKLGLNDYNPKFLKEMKENLLEMRKELLKDVTRSMKEESDHLRFDVGDFYDHASEDRQRELALTLSNREREKLLQIDQALKRIEEGSYGICDVTGEKIGEERLRALPFTTLSVEAQEEIERGVL